jgi:CheY-like chemotaxis protein
MVGCDGPLAGQKEGARRHARIILQVENNPVDAQLLKEIIARRSGLQLLTARNGLQGVEMARSLQPDVVVIDMVMPQVSGLDALNLLRADGQTAHIPVIILSSNAFVSVEKNCLQAGAFAYLTKPYQIGALLASIDSALQYAGA